ncbi:MAG: phosphatidylglycerophosphatase A [Gammaproteobacteria bacterium]|nr:phosphatidylglycerophosphatase A [Gammaproteobacteria bacterium]
MRQNVRQVAVSSPIHLFSFGFGAGLSPVAPGTVGTLVGLAAYLALVPLGPAAYTAVVVLVFLAGCWTCGQTASALGVHDHPGIVADEIVGYLITMWYVPFQWYWILAGFILFRIFDIWKPWPVSWADRDVAGGFGIMLDDVLAALYAMLCLHGMVWAVQVI